MPLILGTNSIKDTGYNVANSCRFNSGDSAVMYKTLGTATNVDKYTISMWVKRARLGHRQMMMRVIDPSSTGSYSFLEFQSGDNLASNDYNGSGSIAKITNAKFRDVSAWYHIVLALDSTQGTASNRSKLYVNGTQVTSFGTDSGGSQNQDLIGNTSGKNIYIGGDGGQDTRYCGLYMAEVCFIDGQQLDATSFGEFDADSPNIWKPIDVSGLTFGNNGFYLDFEDSSNLGNDANGGTDLTESNLTAIDQSTDTCTNNFATLNGLHKIDDWSLAQGNLEFTNNSTGHRMTNSSIAVFQGKWYCEVKMKTEAQSTRVGVIDPDKFIYNTYIHNAGRGYAYKGNDGSTRFNDGTVDSSYGATYTTGDIVDIAMDLDNHKLYFSKNGTFQDSGDPTSGSTGTGSTFDLATGVFYSFGASTQDQGTNPVIEFNFGGTETFTISSGNSDGNGYGNFEYSVPSGYFALCTKNLAEYG